MQDEITQIDSVLIKERLHSVISRLERAISHKNKKTSTEEKMRNQVIKELDTYIVSLETLLNQKK